MLGADAGPGLRREADAYLHANPHVDPNGDSYSHVDADAHPDANAHAYADADADSYSDVYSHPNGDRNGYAHGDTYSHGHLHSYCDPISHTRRSGGAHRPAERHG